MESLAKILEFFAERQPNKIAYRYINQSLESRTIDYQELYIRASQVANYIRHNLPKKNINNDPPVVLLLYPSGIDFITSFFGCFYADVISVPVPVPKLNKSLLKLEGIIEDSKTILVLTLKEIYDNIINTDTLLKKFPNLLWLTIESIGRDDYHDKKIYYPREDNVAFLQYTSGSTSKPKGVIVTHRNIITNQQMIKESFGHNEDTSFVSWLPLFHDMGLIGTVLQPMYLGVPSTLMSPTSFSARPALWLEAITKYQATTSGAPNFAYDLCINKISEIEQEKFDLRSWKVAFNGAEPICKVTMINFINKFSYCGFSKTAFYPCYGLAEATLFVSGMHFDPNPSLLFNVNSSFDSNYQDTNNLIKFSQEAPKLISVGQGSNNQQLKIIDPKLQTECLANIEGEIWVHGSHVALGYWGNPKETQETFYARIDNELDKNYLKTGDLGIIDECGNLYITGRSKDLIVIYGRNLYPYDIESIIITSDSSISGSIVFSVMIKGREQLVAVIEIERSWTRKVDLMKLERKIIGLITISYNINPYKICFVKPYRLPRTTSGKVQRQLCKKLFLEQKLELLNQENSTKKKFEECEKEFIDNKLIQIVAAVLKIDKNIVKESTPLYEYGIDSIKAVELQIRIKKQYSIDINFEVFLERYSVLDLQKSITLNDNHRNLKIITEYSNNATTNNLSAQEYSMWLFDNISEQKYAYNIARVVQLLTEIDHSRFIKALEITISIHPQLRATFPKDSDGKPFRRFNEYPHTPLKIYNDVDSNDLEVIFNKEITKIFDLEKYPLFEIILFYTSNDKCYLYFSAHHIICDLWSFKILLDDLFNNYFVLELNEKTPCRIQESEEEYIGYVTWQTSYLQTNQAKIELTRWVNQFDELPAPVLLPSSNIRPNVQTYNGKHVKINIEKILGELIYSLGKELGATPYVIFFSTYFLLVFLYQQNERITIGSTFNGRASRWQSTIGYFSNPLPISVQINKDLTFTDIVQLVKIAVINSFKSSNIPIIHIVSAVKKKLKFTKNPSFFPLFQLILVYQEVANDKKNWNSLAVPFDGEIITIHDTRLLPFSWLPPIANFDLTFFITAGTNSTFNGYFEYNSDIFLEKNIQLIKEHFLTLLKNVLGNPKVTVVEFEKIINSKLLRESM